MRKRIILIINSLVIIAILGIVYYLFYSNMEKNNSNKGTNDKSIVQKYNQNIPESNIYNGTQSISMNSDSIQDYSIEYNKIYLNGIREQNKRIEEQKKFDEAQLIRENEYNKSAESLDKNIFETNLEQYDTPQDVNSKINITQKKANKIAEIGFAEAKRVVGEYSKNKRIEIKEVNPNNFFTRKYNEPDKVYDYQRKAYVVTKDDDFMNGVSIYIDVTTGKIIGAQAFGD